MNVLALLQLEALQKEGSKVSVADQAFEVWRQMDDLIAGMEQADEPDAAAWEEHRAGVIDLLRAWRNRLRRLATQAGDVDPSIQRAWNFPNGAEDERA